MVEIVREGDINAIDKMYLILDTLEEQKEKLEKEFE